MLIRHSLLNSLGLARTSTNLRKQQIDTERRLLVVQVSLELGDLLAQHVWCVSDTTEDTDSSGVGHGSGELRSSSHIHASKHDGVLDLQQIRKLGAELL